MAEFRTRAIGRLIAYSATSPRMANILLRLCHDVARGIYSFVGEFYPFIVLQLANCVHCTILQAH